MTVLELVKQHPEIGNMSLTDFYFMLVIAVLLADLVLGIIKWILFNDKKRNT